MPQNGIGLASITHFTTGSRISPLIMTDAQEKNDPSSDLVNAEIVDAEIVPAVLVGDGLQHSTAVPSDVQPDTLSQEESHFDTNVNYLSAKGGAVGGLLLALLGLVAMAFSSYSIFNVLMAVAFSLWGLKSPLRKTAIAGLLIATVGLVAFLVKLEN